MVNLDLVILLYIWVFRVNVPTQLTFDFTVLDSHAVGESIVLDEFSHCVAVFDPGDDSDFITNGSNTIPLNGVAFFVGRTVKHLVDEGEELHDPLI
jgi:hypothetical protein